MKFNIFSLLSISHCSSDNSSSSFFRFLFVMPSFWTVWNRRMNSKALVDDSYENLLDFSITSVFGGNCGKL
jgi:hypothetical protein